MPDSLPVNLRVFAAPEQHLSLVDLNHVKILLQNLETLEPVLLVLNKSCLGKLFGLGVADKTLVNILFFILQPVPPHVLDISNCPHPVQERVLWIKIFLVQTSHEILAKSSL